MRLNKPSCPEEFSALLQWHLLEVPKIAPGTVDAMLAPKFSGCDFEEKKAVFSFTVQKWMLNFSGSLHGGMLATMLDLAMGVLMRCYSARYPCPTIDLHVCYSRPAFEGDEVIVQTNITSVTKSFIDVYSSAYKESINSPIATSTARFFYKS